LTIVGETTFDYRVHPAAFPVLTSWSLSIELVSYLLLAIYFARSKYRLVALAALGSVDTYRNQSTMAAIVTTAR
jgi:peptidoglycan/LPS O-acetylase OafA/YrhL